MPGCRLPGDISGPSQLWDFLAQGRTAAGTVPSSRFNVDSYHGAPDEPAVVRGNGGYFLQEDIRQFDNQFFGINNREATDMDPQQRKLLEVVYETLENAGVPLEQVSGANVGCYVAYFAADFIALQTKDPESVTRYTQAGMGSTILANRISHVFNLKGPSCVVDTACSSSLYALHLACSALQNGECDSAVVAGVNLIQSPDVLVAMSQAGVLSPSSICHTFDAAADGYGRADGVNALYVKRLSDAIRDGDPIRSIIRGTATNSNGRTPGITQPSIDGQEAVSQKAYRRTGLKPADTAYVEMHGTGTSVGDPMEAEAVSRVFRREERQQHILVGGCKPNLGHGEASSGITSIIKATLALERAQLPPTIGITRQNPKLRLDDWGMQIVTDLTPFPEPAPGLARRISINSFGYGGANAHGILEEAGQGASSDADSLVINETSDPTLRYLLPFSANKVPSLERRVQQLSKRDLPAAALPDLAYTLGQRRSHLAQRGYVLARSDTLATDLDVQNLRQAPVNGDASWLNKNVVFAFTGQGAQWKGMGRELLQIPTFANTIHQLDDVLRLAPYAPSWSIMGILQDDSEACPINQAAFAQPITTAVQVGLVKLLRSLSIEPQGVVGHSSGEIGAAYAAGLLTLREAILVAYYRGYAVSHYAPEGAMAAVGLGPDAARDWIHRAVPEGSTVQVACLNSPQSVTVSGDLAGIDGLVAALQSAGVFVRKLKTDGKAYHSYQMGVVGAEYEKLLQEADTFVDAQANTSARMFSTVLDREVHERDVRTITYWRQNLESPVLFAHGLHGVTSLWKGDCAFVELGPHAVLKMPIAQTLGKSTPYLATLQRNQDSLVSVLGFVGDLFVQGYAVNFAKVQSTFYPSAHGAPKVLCDLPSYPWHYEELLWNESRISREGRHRKHKRHELLGSPVVGGNHLTFGWRNLLRLDNVPWLRDHQLSNTPVFPAAGYLAMAVEALLQVAISPNVSLAEQTVALRHVELPSALPLAELTPIELYTELRPHALSTVSSSRDWWDFQIASIIDDTPTIRARGTVRLEPSGGIDDARLPSANCRVEAHSKRLWYEGIAKAGLGYGPTFQHMQEVLTPNPKGTLYCEARIDTLNPKFEGVQSAPRYLLHPALLDNLLQAGLVASTGGHLQSMVAKVPTRLGYIRLCQPSQPQQQGIIRCTSAVTGFATHRMNAALWDAQQQPVAHFEEVDIPNYVGSEQMTDEVRDPLFRVVWKPDFDLISDGTMLAAAIQHVRATTELGRLGSHANLLSAIDLAVHKDPDADILVISPDVSLTALAMLEVLEARTTHQRFRSLHLGRFDSAGQLEVAEVHVSGLKFGIRSLSYVAASSGLKFGLIVLATPEAWLLDQLVAYTDGHTRLVGFNSNDSIPSDHFTSIRTPDCVVPGVQLLRPVYVSNGVRAGIDRIIHVVRSQDAAEEQLRNDLSATLLVPTEQHTLAQVPSAPIDDHTLVVSTVELKHAVLANPSPEDYAGIQHILTQATQVVWATGSGATADSDPTRSLFPGLARAIMVEQPSTKIFSIELDPNANPETISSHVAKVVRQANHPTVDHEFLQSSAGLLISRVVPDERMNTYFRDQEQGTARLVPLVNAGQVRLSVEKPGQLSSVRFVPSPQQTVRPDEVVVKVSCIGLNAKDVYALAGRVETPEATCSGEWTGQIVSVGSAVQHLAVGDQVAVLYPGHFSTYETVPARACVKLRPGEDLRSMASILVVYTTALYALEHRAHLQAGESVLIHSAAGGLGIAAIQVAKLKGAEIFATVGTEEKKQYLVNHFGLQPDHILNSHETGFASRIRELTNGRGVDVVLNSLAGELLLESWECLGHFGRFVELGKRDIRDHGRLPMEPFGRGATFTAFDLALLVTSPSLAPVLAELLTRVVALIRSGAIQPVQPLKVFPASELQAAFNYFNNTARMGKVVISFEDPNQQITMVPPRFATRLHPDKSYLMVGCLGGLGRSLSKWMVQRGARQFIFLGRTGLQRPAAQRLIEDLEHAGAHCIVVPGDVTNPADVERAVTASSTPLGGVVQAAMGLHEALFAGMPHDAWVEGTHAKVHGTWNLHQALSQHNREHALDFFVVTSSINGKMGTATESNYCAANNFLDVFARYRRSLGRPAISLGLGMIAEVGYLHENPHIEDLLLRRGLRPITEDELLRIFDYGLSQPPTSIPARDAMTHSLLLTGLEVTGLLRQHQQGFSGYWHFLDDARFAILASTLRRQAGTSSRSSSSSNTSTAWTTALSSKDEEQLTSAAQDLIAQKLANLVLLPLAKLNVNSSLSAFGMDSMLAAELRQYLYSVTGVDVPFLTLMDAGTSVVGLAGWVGGEAVKSL
ncbi:type I polyketide synthase [Aspergillus ibericus CBS 121593]|uniref:Putative polyketide synthase n=1 Tax=Aspergillus ibericus CBS 121593 TaxID=1448316 RepID=A0A395GZ27_9EURO|nr:putative polyketide synthase [Aspergillus ibericus CBS 121593]RAK99273.1 putative polyketide synthase [Aspergillus ibericus CBS 121593]